MAKVKIEVEALLIYSPREGVWIVYGENKKDDDLPRPAGSVAPSGAALSTPELLRQLAIADLWHDELGEIAKTVKFEVEIELPEAKPATVEATVLNAG